MKKEKKQTIRSKTTAISYFVSHLANYDLTFIYYTEFIKMLFQIKILKY